MDNLPTEILIEIMIKTDHNALLDLIKTNTRMNDIYVQNKKYIYKQKLHRQYPCIETPEDLYYTLYHSRDKYDQICKLKKIYTEPECKDIMLYIGEVVKYILQNSNKLKETYGRERASEKKISIYIELFTNINRCYDQLDTTVKGALLSKIKEFDRDIRESGINSQVWSRFYATTGQAFIRKVESDTRK
jgi:hypothetical protein